MMNARLLRIPALAAAAALASAALVACGDDDDSADADPVGDVGAVSDDAPADDGADDASDDTVVVTLDDYRFIDLPATVAAGTQFSVINVAEEELHELVAFRLPDDEERSVEELVGLPPEEFGALIGQIGEPATVLLATPGDPQIPAVGDGTIDEPGRYAVMCFIPIGVDPAAYFQAAEETEEGPPQVEGAGPPHFTAGMYAELTVE